MLAAEQERNYAFYLAHLPEYLNDALLEGKFGVFYGEQLAKVFDTFESAISYAVYEYGEGFVVQELVDELEYVNYNKWLEVGA